MKTQNNKRVGCIKEYIINPIFCYFKEYILSFKLLKSYKWKILWMILTDIFYVLLIYLIIMFSYGNIMNQYMNELLPISQKVGIIKQANSPEEIKELTQKLFYDISKTGDINQIKSSILLTSGWFIGKIILTIIVLLFLASFTRALVWSFVKKSFKKFHKFVFYNVVWIVFCLAIFTIMLILIKIEILTKISLLLLLVYLYLSLILRIKYDVEKPLFKQIVLNPLFGVKYFIYYLLPFVLIALTFIVTLSIISLIQYILPPFVTGLILLMILFTLVTWSRIYLHMKTMLFVE